MITVDIKDQAVRETVTRIINRSAVKVPNDKSLRITDSSTVIPGAPTLVITDELKSVVVTDMVIILPISKKNLTAGINKFLSDNYI